jgi:hypothetical protein
MISACPVCGRGTPPLPQLSETSFVFYFRCDGCRHIWTVNKASGDINHVTPLPPQRAENPQ